MYPSTPSNPASGTPHKRSWRKHSDEFKARVVELARQPHVSMAAIALANGINANMLRRWVRASLPTCDSGPLNLAERNASAHSFVQLPMQPPDKPTFLNTGPASPSNIDVQIQRGESRVLISLPMMSASAAWLREVLG